MDKGQQDDKQCENFYLFVFDAFGDRERLWTVDCQTVYTPCLPLPFPAYTLHATRYSPHALPLPPPAGPRSGSMAGHLL